MSYIGIIVGFDPTEDGSIPSVPASLVCCLLAVGNITPMKKKPQIKVIHYVHTGTTLADLIAWAIAEGATEKDFSEFKIEMDYTNCCTCTDDNEGYCYCPTAYSDIRLQRSV